MSNGRHNRMGLIAVAICLLQGTAMYLLSLRGTLFADDFLDYSIAHENHVGLHYFAISNFEHFQPGLRAAFLFFQRVLPFDYDVVRIVMVLVDVAAMLAFWRLLTLLIGSRSLSLVLLTVFGFSLAMLSANLWLTASVNNLPMLLPLILSVDGHLRWMVHHRVRDLVLAAVALAVAVTFYEKPLLFGIYIPLLFILIFARDFRVRSMVDSLLRAWPLWALDVVLLVPYLYYTVRHPYTATKPPGNIGAYFDGTARSWFFGVVPNTLGGPVPWVDQATIAVLPSTAAAVAGQVVVAASMALTALVRRGALRWWLFLAVVVISNAVLIVQFRASAFGTGIAADPRYLLDTAMLMLTAIGLAAVGPRIGPHAARPGWRHTALAQAVLRFVASPVRRRGAALIAAVVSVTSFALPAIHEADTWAVQDAVPWLANLRSSDASLPPGATVWDVDVPFGIVVPVFAPYNRISRLLPLLDRRATYDQGPDRSYVPRPDGTLVPAHYVPDAQGSAPEPVAVAVPGAPVSGMTCITGRGGIVAMSTRLDHPVAPGVEFLVFRYTATPGTVIHVADTDAEGHDHSNASDPVVLPGTQGVAVVRLWPVELASVRIEMLSAGSLCATSASVGHPAW